MQEDWGEQNTAKKAPAVYLLSLRDWSVKRVQGFPAGVSVGQAVLSPDGGPLPASAARRPAALEGSRLQLCARQVPCLAHGSLGARCPCWAPLAGAVVRCRPHAGQHVVATVWRHDSPLFRRRMGVVYCTSRACSLYSVPTAQLGVRATSCSSRLPAGRAPVLTQAALGL